MAARGEFCIAEEVTRGSHVAAGDFDGDGKTDVVIGSRFVSGYYVASQQDDGAFHVRQTNAPARSYMDMQLADVNGNERDDLLTSCGERTRRDVFTEEIDAMSRLLNGPDRTGPAPRE